MEEQSWRRGFFPFPGTPAPRSPRPRAFAHQEKSAPETEYELLPTSGGHCRIRRRSEPPDRPAAFRAASHERAVRRRLVARGSKESQSSFHSPGKDIDQKSRARVAMSQLTQRTCNWQRILVSLAGCWPRAGNDQTAWSQAISDWLGAVPSV